MSMLLSYISIDVTYYFGLLLSATFPHELDEIRMNLRKLRGSQNPDF